MRNTKQTFIFAYRGYPSNVYITDFLKRHGFEFAHIKNIKPHVNKKEINWHAEWPKFIGGGVKHLDEIKGKYWKYLSKEAKVKTESVKDTFQDLSIYGIIAQIVQNGKWGK